MDVMWRRGQRWLTMVEKQTFAWVITPEHWRTVQQSEPINNIDTKQLLHLTNITSAKISSTSSTEALFALQLVMGVKQGNNSSTYIFCGVFQHFSGCPP
eukprot:6187259-Amphidinium_carterae.1